MTDLARKWSDSLGLSTDQKAQIQRSHQVSISHALGTDLKPQMSKRSGQTPTHKAENTEGQPSPWVNWKDAYPTEQRDGDTRPAWPLLWEAQKEKRKFPLLISNNRSQLYWVWGLNIHNYCGWKKMWIFSLNWFQLGDILRHLTKANSNLLWKKILQNGTSVNSWTLSYRENKLFFFFYHKTHREISHPGWESAETRNSRIRSSETTNTGTNQT